MAVYENKTINFLNDDNDLSKYILHLNLSIQRRSDKSKNKPITINSNMFQLKNVNLKSKNKMDIFFESMFKATLSALASGAVEGEISIIEETINFTKEYIQTSIENTENNKTNFDPIDAENSFEPFTLNNQSEIVYVDLYFPIKQEYMDSENCIVLAIDTLFNLEKRISLVPRYQNI